MGEVCSRIPEMQELQWRFFGWLFSRNRTPDAITLEGQLTILFDKTGRTGTPDAESVNSILEYQSYQLFQETGALEHQMENPEVRMFLGMKPETAGAVTCCCLVVLVVLGFPLLIAGVVLLLTRCPNIFRTVGWLCPCNLKWAVLFSLHFAGSHSPSHQTHPRVVWVSLFGSGHKFCTISRVICTEFNWFIEGNGSADT